ncbi:hypothetical protein DSO57_1015076 [Entomophthora muscae]|uniref:Uncharacterized protein n=1 Tax=Entomophthora muscae TaxID=34485 RepID=A0ACC2SIQ5_9FUNG|nr:hypothetical protein DSO57_1015076 [Entomophthora muscae]
METTEKDRTLIVHTEKHITFVVHREGQDLGVKNYREELAEGKKDEREGLSEGIDNNIERLAEEEGAEEMSKGCQKKIGS